MFYFLLNSSFSKKIEFLRKLKLIYPSTPYHYNSCSAPSFLILFKKLLAPPLLQKVAETAFYTRDYKGETIKLLPFYMTDFYLQNCKVINFEENQKIVWKMIYLNPKLPSYFWHKFTITWISSHRHQLHHKISLSLWDQSLPAASGGLVL